MSTIKLCSGVGKYHTNKNGGTLDAISWPEVKAMVDAPPQVEKDNARWVIPSTRLSRVHKEQEQRGKFYMHWLDVDKGNVPLERLVEVIKSIAGDVAVEIYSSRSATPEILKWRVLLPTAKPLSGAEWVLTQECLNDALEAAGITPDRASERAGQPCYLPNRGSFYETYSKRSEPCLDALAVFAPAMAQKLAQEAAQAAELERQREAAKARRDRLSVTDAPDTIGAFNQAYTVDAILLQAGYDQRGNTFRHPNSESGSFSASVKDGRVHALSTSDPLFVGMHGKTAHDAFSAFTVLFHQGDQKAALKDAGDNWLAIGSESWNTVKQREWAKQQGKADAGTGQPDSKERTESASSGPSKGSAVVLTCAANITPEPINWIWPGWLAAGKLHILAGAPGTGKTTIAMNLAAIISTGGNWPDGSKAEQGKVVIWTGEDDPADTLVPRLIAAGADLSQIHFVIGIREDEEPARSFDPARDADILNTQVAELGNVRFVLVDPVVSAVAGDSHKNTEVRRALQPLVDMAASTGCVLFGITHLTKGTQGRDPLERLTGSLAFGAVARVVMAAAKNKTGEGVHSRLFCRIKSNIGPDDGGFAYDLHQHHLDEQTGLIASAVEWGEALAGGARELLADAEISNADDGGSSLAEAKDFLLGLLSEGPVPTNQVKKDADGAGHAWRTIERANKSLGVHVYKDSQRAGQWFWKLHQEAAQGRPPEDRQDSRTKKDGGLGGLHTKPQQEQRFGGDL